MMEGRKDDADKVRMELLPPELLIGTAQVLTFGAKKYGSRNWEKGMAWSRVYGALERHLWAWWGGEHVDAETGLSHLKHAACCLSFLMAYEARAIGEDDRPVPADGDGTATRITREQVHELTRKIFGGVNDPNRVPCAHCAGFGVSLTGRGEPCPYCAGRGYSVHRDGEEGPCEDPRK